MPLPLLPPIVNRRITMYDAIAHYLTHLIYGYYPYLAGTVFLLGSLLRFDHGQYTWKTGSSQMLSSKNMR
ncbi:respiratory nitrate reductase subunit gamma, partial [Pollutimonas sp. H1-120]